MLSEGTDLKKYTYIRFRQDLKHHTVVMRPGQDLVMVFLEGIDLDLPLALPSDARHLLAEGFHVEQVVIESPLLPQAAGMGGKGFG